MDVSLASIIALCLAVAAGVMLWRHRRLKRRMDGLQAEIAQLRRETLRVKLALEAARDAAGEPPVAAEDGGNR